MLTYYFRPTLPNAFSRARVTASIILPVSSKSRSATGTTPDASIEPFEGAAFLPPLRASRQFAASPDRPHSFLSTPTTPTRRSNLRNSVFPDDEKRASMTENEILDYHLSQGTVPLAFAPIAVGQMAQGVRSSTLSLNGSVTASVLGYAEMEPKRDSKASNISFLWPKLSPGPAAPKSPTIVGSPRHSRFSSLSASIRFPGSSPPTSPARSIFTFGKKHERQISQLPQPTSDNQQTVKIAKFSPLLPDELVLRQGETVTVVETFDDEWCIVARLNLGMLEVGAVPNFVFGLKEGEDETFATMRPMRSTSLGVTVDLRVIAALESGGSGKHWVEATYRDSVISWSNF